MPSVKETLESLTTFCWETTEEGQINQKVKEYLKNYPHLHSAAGMDLLQQIAKTWLRIRELEEMMKKTEDLKLRSMLFGRIERMTRTWLAMLANAGVTFTKQQYISKKKGGQTTPPVEELKKLLKKKKEEKFT